MKSADGNVEYIEWVEGITKTRQGGLTKQNRGIPQIIFATGGEQCPVHLLEKLVSKHPPSLGPLYLTPLKKFQPDDKTWFLYQPVGVNTINSFMKELAKKAGLDVTNKHFTNHSLRKTTIQKLQKAGVSNEVRVKAQLTGIYGSKLPSPRA